MPTYWDRFARTYTNIGEAEFWLKHRRRITEGLSGRVLEVCCGGGRLVLELLKVGIDAYGMDLSPQMAAQAQAPWLRPLGSAHSSGRTSHAAVPDPP
jgi:SAM-dependent methyltransferase